MQKKVLYFYLAIILLIIVLPINGKDSKANHTFILNLRMDYFFHGLVFFPWMGFLLLNNKLMKPALWLMIGLFFAVSTEALQLFLSYRTFNINDIVANSCGILIGSCLLLFDQKKQPVT